MNEPLRIKLAFNGKVFTPERLVIQKGYVEWFEVGDTRITLGEPTQDTKTLLPTGIFDVDMTTIYEDDILEEIWEPKYDWVSVLHANYWIGQTKKGYIKNTYPNRSLLASGLLKKEPLKGKELVEWSEVVPKIEVIDGKRVATEYRVVGNRNEKHDKHK